jgi:hypothetical protein
VECYSGWAGPCKAVASSLKALFFSYNDRPIKFYTVSASSSSSGIPQPVCYHFFSSPETAAWSNYLLPNPDYIILQVNTDKVKEKGLDQYRNKCQPVFLLYKVNTHKHPGCL